jgi:hypothetical protein
MNPSSKQHIFVDVPKCGACGGEHKRLEMFPLTVPIKLWVGGSVIEYTHFGHCPVMNEPLYMKMDRV